MDELSRNYMALFQYVRLDAHQAQSDDRKISHTADMQKAFFSHD